MLALKNIARKIHIRDALEMALESEAALSLRLYNRSLSPRDRLAAIYAVVHSRRRIVSLEQRLG